MKNRLPAPSALSIQAYANTSNQSIFLANKLIAKPFIP